MLKPDLVDRIRSIFLHDGEPVTPGTAAEWLGWDFNTMEQAIKWRAVKLDELRPETPRITFPELLVHATDQWTFAEIRQALGEDARDIFDDERSTLSATEIIDAVMAHVVRQGYRREAAECDSAARRRRGRGRNVPPAAVSLPPARRVRDDGVREFTLTRIEREHHRFVPYLRLRGRWLARLGFKPGMRVYVDSTPGQLTISVCDPARAKRSASVTSQARFSPDLLAACAAVGSAAAARPRGRALASLFNDSNPF